MDTTNTNIKPLIKKNDVTGEMIAGFLDRETGEFEADCEIESDEDIDEFLNRHDLTFVMIVKM